MSGDERQGESAPARAEARRPDEWLRQQAEKRVNEEAKQGSYGEGPLPMDEVRKVIHELRVHQTELEIQNEELLRIQGDLDASRRRYQDLFDLAPVSYFTLDDKGLILEVNLTAAAMLREEREALVRQPFTHFIDPSDQDPWYEQRRQLFETGAPRSLELALRRADRTTLPGLLDVSLARDAEGKAVARVAVSDISERKREESERRRLQHRLQQAEKVESLGRMAGAIAHHFNNLLAVTAGNLELAIDDLLPNAAQVEGLTDALTAAREAGEVSRLLLTYLGQSEGEPSVQDLSELCRRSLPILRASLPARMELEDDLPSPGPGVEVIAGEIQQVLANLVTNAWEAVDGGNAGVVHLSVSTVAPEEIPTSGRFPVGWVPGSERYSRLAVSDPGRGIEEGMIDLIFDPFFTTKEFGRGLGLSVALGSVQAHGGAIAVKAGLAGGSSVEVYLPVSAGEAPEPGGNGSETPSATRGKGTVLLVEDDDLLRKVAEKMLGRLGYTVLPARDGVEAVELFREHRERISWVLCDLIMPRMNGWDTLAALRALDPDVHVVLTSGYDEAHAPSDVPRERAQAFLGKPWTLEQLSSAAPKLGH